MFRRRIEITRERSRSLSVAGPSLLLCRSCGVRTEIVPVSEAASRVGMPAREIEGAIAAGHLHSWSAGEHSFVCLRCTNNLERKNRNA